MGWHAGHITPGWLVGGVVQGLLAASMAVAPVHMPTLLATLLNLSFQDVKSLLNFAAPLNMSCMVVTFFVSQSFMVSWSALLNFAAPSNMPSIDVTAEVSQVSPVPPSSLLNAAAPLNMFFMFVTAFVSQVLMSWSNNMAPWNMPSMSVTA